MKKENITPDDQREVTRLCVQTALLLLQHGAESTIVAQMTQRLGLALGVESVECALTANAVIITTLANDHCITTARKNTDKGINMQMVTDVQRIVISAEHKIYNLHMVRKKLAQLKPLKYNRYFVLLMIGLSCASFAHLSGGDALISLITFNSRIHCHVCASGIVQATLQSGHRLCRYLFRRFTSCRCQLEISAR